MIFAVTKKFKKKSKTKINYFYILKIMLKFSAKFHFFIFYGTIDNNDEPFLRRYEIKFLYTSEMPLNL